MRYYKDDKGHIHPGRIGILKTYRNQGYGKKLLQWFDQYMLGLYQEAHIVLHAQKHLEGFYQTLGYQSKGKPFMEANIEHIAMEKILKRSTF